MRVLVTGAGGFVGRHLCRALKRHEVVGVTRDVNRALFPDPAGETSGPDVTWCIGNLANPKFAERVVLDYEPEVVVHLAAKSIVLTAQEAAFETYSSNVIGTVNLLDACTKLREKPHFILMSTDKVVPYDNAKEDFPYAFQLGHYARSKMMQELLLREYPDIPSAVLRSCNIYGGGDLSRRIIPNTVRAAIRGEPPVIYREHPPSHRQYIYVGDVVGAITLLIQKRATGLWHVGTPDVLTQEQVVLRILEHFPGVKPRYVPRKHGVEVIQQSLNYERIQRELGWRPKVSFDRGIKLTIDWYKRWLE